MIEIIDKPPTVGEVLAIMLIQRQPGATPETVDHLRYLVRSRTKLTEHEIDEMTFEDFVVLVQRIIGVLARQSNTNDLDNLGKFFDKPLDPTEPD